MPATRPSRRARLYGGYCFFNNAAIVAHHLADDRPKVTVLDVDYHHGNGTQEIFYDPTTSSSCRCTPTRTGLSVP